MESVDLSNNDHGMLAEAIIGRYAGYPDPLTDAITRHAKATYSDLIPDQDDEIKLISESRGFTQQTPLTTIEGIGLPETGNWGYNRGWKPDDIIGASWRIYNSDAGEYYSVVEEFEKRGSDCSPHLRPVASIGGENPVPGSAHIYYLVEVKAVTAGDRVRLTENQHEMMEVVSEEVDFVHPIVVLVDINDLPESVEMQVDIYEESTWGMGRKSKYV